jgi:Flp pilus assembly pilin Flp
VLRKREMGVQLWPCLKSKRRFRISYNQLYPDIFLPRAGGYMLQFFRRIITDEQGQDIAEYAVMLAVILVLVIGTVRLIGGNANNAFSTVASTLQ